MNAWCWLRTTLVTAVIVLAMTGLCTAGSRDALVIGADRYLELRPLSNAANDARAVASALGDLGFDVELVIDPTLAQLRDAVDRFHRHKDRDIALLYYAGHGFQIEGKNALIPVDAKTSSIRELASTVMMVEPIVRSMTETTETSLVVLDACRDAPFGAPGLPNGRSARPLSGLGPRPSFNGNLPSILRTVDRLPAARGKSEQIVADVAMMFSTSPNELADDGRYGLSPFARAFVRWIQRSGEVDLQSLFVRITSDVYSATNRRQRPWIAASLSKVVYLRQ